MVSISGRVFSISGRSEKYFQEVRKLFVDLVASNVENSKDKIKK